jgi:hypothetical protein
MERAQRKEEWVAKEAELDEREAEYIWKLNTKEINEEKFRELVSELDLERAMGEHRGGADNYAGDNAG